VPSNTACKVSRERIQHAPACPRLAFSHNSISTLVKQRGWFHTACLIPATVATTIAQSYCAHLTRIQDSGEIQPISVTWTSGGTCEVCKKKEKKWFRQQKTTGDTPTHGRQTNPFNTSPYKQKAKKKNDISLYSCQVRALLHSFTHSLFISSSFHLPPLHYGFLSVDISFFSASSATSLISLLSLMANHLL